MSNDENGTPPSPTNKESVNCVTIRLIRSFEHRNWKPLVLTGVSLGWTTEELTEQIQKQLMESQIRDVFKKYTGYDTLKIEYHPHGAKSNDPLINRSPHPSLILRPKLTLGAQGIQDGSEISYFCNKDYLTYDSSNLSHTNPNINVT